MEGLFPQHRGVSPGEMKGASDTPSPRVPPLEGPEMQGTPGVCNQVSSLCPMQRRTSGCSPDDAS